VLYCSAYLVLINADACLASSFLCLQVCAPLTGYDLTTAAGGAVGPYLAAMDARASCATAEPDAALLLQAFRKHSSLDFFDYSTYSCFQLHPHNAHLLL